jgi:uncharacterized protein YbbC (DUF1343 family)
MKCGGVSLLLDGPESLNSVLLGLTIISVLHRLYPEEFDAEGVLRLLGNAEALKLLKSGVAPAEVLRRGETELRKFLEKRKRALIYD